MSENFSQEKKLFFAFTKLGKIIRFPVKRGIDCTMCLLNGSRDQNQQPALLGHGHPLISKGIGGWYLIIDQRTLGKMMDNLCGVYYFSLWGKPWE